MKNIPIVGKFLAVFAIFGVFALAIAAYTANQIMSIDAQYSKLIASDSAGAAKLLDAKATLLRGRAALADLMISFTPEANAAAEAEIRTARNDFEARMGDLDRILPDEPRVGEIRKAGLTLFDETCQNAMNLGASAATNDQAIASQKVFGTQCQPAFVTVGDQLHEFATAIAARADAESDRLTAASIGVSHMTVAAIIGGFIVVLAIGIFAVRSWIVRPLGILAGTMKVLAGGDLSAEVLGTERRDEVGSMAKAVEVFKENGLKARQLEDDAVVARSVSETERQRIAEADRRRAAEMAEATNALGESLKALSNGDLTYQLATPFAADFESLRADFNAAVAQLHDTLLAISDSSDSIDNGSRELSNNAADLSQRTERQAASLEETASALDQITTNVLNSTSRTRDARGKAIEANTSAQQSAAVVAKAVRAMQSIETSSNEISSIIGVIDEIAFQTNLLALNAGVEAARAGEAGKGFAVVAQEVRELAQRSAKAAKEIKELIRTSAQEVESGVKLVTETGEALRIIEHHIISINTELDAIATSAQEQSAGLSQINSAVNEMDQVTQDNATMVEEANAASASLASEAERLRVSLNQFRLNGMGATGHKAQALLNKGPRPAFDDRPVASPARRMVSRVAASLGIAAQPEETVSWSKF